MSEMIERVKHAIFCAAEYGDGMVICNWDEVVRAAIESMRTITPGMSGAGKAAVMEHGGGLARDEAEAVWDAMIDEALKE